MAKRRNDEPTSYVRLTTNTTMRDFFIPSKVRNLPESEITIIEQRANEGDPVACYKLAQILLAWRDTDDYLDQVEPLLATAAEGGVIDAYVAKAAILCEEGMLPEMFLDAQELLEFALENKSEYATKVYIENIIFGKWGYEVDLDKAIELLSELLQTSDNPMWHHMMGLATEIKDGLYFSTVWYEGAVNGGYDDAWYNLAVARAFDDDYELEDEEWYKETLQEGIDRNDTTSLVHYACHIAKDWEEMSDEDAAEKAALANSIISAYDTGYKAGLPVACYLLGKVYENGLYGQDVDYGMAMEIYKRGVLFNSVICVEAMYDMLQNDFFAALDEDNELSDQCALKGARGGSERLVVATVDAYYEGRLKEYADEIEKYFIPIYNDMADSEMDDDGRYDAWD